MKYVPNGRTSSSRWLECQRPAPESSQSSCSFVSVACGGGRSSSAAAAAAPSASASVSHADGSTSRQGHGEWQERDMFEYRSRNVASSASAVLGSSRRCTRTHPASRGCPVASTKDTRGDGDGDGLAGADVLDGVGGTDPSMLRRRWLRSSRWLTCQRQQVLRRGIGFPFSCPGSICATKNE